MADTNVSYLKLVTSEHSVQPKYMEYVKTTLDMISPDVDMYNDFDVLFALDSAAGDQLDKLGELVGIGRKLPIVDARIPATLDDDSFRLVIKAKLYKNRWDGTRKGLEEIFEAMFPSIPYEIVDNQDMSYTVMLISPEADDIFIGLIMNGYILPKPSGVRVEYRILDSTLFGWDSDTEFIKGWDKANWSSR